MTIPRGIQISVARLAVDILNVLVLDLLVIMLSPCGKETGVLPLEVGCPFFVLGDGTGRDNL